jgi:serine/threonine protein kinase
METHSELTKSDLLTGAKHVGSGSFGDVYRCWSSKHQQFVAVKQTVVILEQAPVLADGAEVSAKRRRYCQEVPTEQQMLQALAISHPPNIAELKELFYTYGEQVSENTAHHHSREFSGDPSLPSNEVTPFVDDVADEDEWSHVCFSAKLNLVFKFYNLGSLRENLQAQALSPNDKMSCIRQIFTGLEALAARNIMHRDIKPEVGTRNLGTSKTPSD